MRDSSKLGTGTCLPTTLSALWHPLALEMLSQSLCWRELVQWREGGFSEETFISLPRPLYHVPLCFSLTGVFLLDSYSSLWLHQGYHIITFKILDNGILFAERGCWGTDGGSGAWGTKRVTLGEWYVLYFNLFWSEWQLYEGIHIELYTHSTVHFVHLIFCFEYGYGKGGKEKI